MTLKKRSGKRSNRPQGPPRPRFPLPSDSQPLAAALYQRAENIGLLFNKYLWIWDEEWTLEGKFRQNKQERSVKSVFLARVEAMAQKFPPEAYDAFLKRQTTISESFHDHGYDRVIFSKRAEARILSGFGGAHPMEVGFAFHPLYGFPYLPGSGLKGVARAWAELTEQDLAEVKFVFGSESKDERQASKHQQGDVIFLDAYATKPPKLEVDILNPHFPDYYRDPKKNLPTEWQSPNPVNFLTIGVGQRQKDRPIFQFILVARSPEALRLAQDWLERGLEELGFGGKTASGYGFFASPAGLAAGIPSEPSTAEGSPQADSSQSEPAARLPAEIREVQLMPLNQVAPRIRQYYDTWKTLRDEGARRELAGAIVRKMQEANLMKKWKSKDWVKELQQFVTETES